MMRMRTFNSTVVSIFSGLMKDPISAHTTHNINGPICGPARSIHYLPGK